MKAIGPPHTQILEIIIAAAIFFIMQQHVHITAGYVYCPVNGSVHVDYETITVGYSGSGKNNNKLFCYSKTMSKLYMGVI